MILDCGEMKVEPSRLEQMQALARDRHSGKPRTRIAKDTDSSVVKFRYLAVEIH